MPTFKEKSMNDEHVFNDFYRRMRLKWRFQDEPDTFSKRSAFSPKST